MQIPAFSVCRFNWANQSVEMCLHSLSKQDQEAGHPILSSTTILMSTVHR